MVGRILILLFGLVSYSIFFASFLYLIGFLGNLQTTALAEQLPLLKTLIPYSIDAGRETGPMATALLINIGLIALFGLQHSIMARSGFKGWLTRMLPKTAERSFYVLLTSLILILMYWQWRPITGTVLWSAEASWAVTLGWSVFAAGFGLVLLSTFLIDHFDLFGLRQVWLQFINKDHGEPAFRTPLFYRFIRHPLYLGWFLAFWGTPVMTLGHLLFALGMSSYILIAIVFEERDLMRIHGEKYRQYREQVPMLVPVPGKSWKA